MTKKALTATEQKHQKKIHGMLLYADKLCRDGKAEKAKKYLSERGLPFPPFSDTVTNTAQKKEEEPPHAETQPQGVTTETTSGESHAESGEPIRGLPGQAEGFSGADEACSPIETASPEPSAPAARKCRVTHMCPNPRLIGVRFLDNGEDAAVWVSRKGYHIGDVLSVELERGIPGINAVYQQTKIAL